MNVLELIPVSMEEHALMVSVVSRVDASQDLVVIDVRQILVCS